jgi:sigma-B regulation protein RsbU (phosphoserine phosphatase)
MIRLKNRINFSLDMTQILIVDDDAAMQILLSRALTKSGYEIILAKDGEEGLNKAKEIKPALIICDWLMPGLTGLEVCRHVKANPQLATTFFILLTSRVSIEDRVRGLDAGSDDFLCKPIDLQELKARVRAGLRLHQLSEDLQRQKQLLEAELAEAAEYVASILPEPLTNSFVSIDVRFLPSRQLGGDSFDYFWLDSEHLAIYLLDVSGHGLRAALPSISVVNLLRSRNLNQVNYYQPSNVLTQLNYTFQMTQHNDKYFTIWYGVYHIFKRELVYASAGHPPAILLSIDARQHLREQRLSTRGIPIGIFPEESYQDSYCSIEPQSTLYLFSDGVYELNQGGGNIWGLDNFVEVLRQHKNQSEADLEQILERVKIQNISNNFDDDLSLMQIDFF